MKFIKRYNQRKNMQIFYTYPIYYNYVSDALSQSYMKRFVWYQTYDSQSIFKSSLRLHYYTSGGCNLVNWLNQTRRNFTTEYLNLNFVTTPKLTPLRSSFAERVFLSCVWLIPVLLVRTMDSVPRPSFSDTNILQHILSDLKFSTRSVTIDIFNLLKRKTFFAWGNSKELVEGLGNGSFVTITNLARYFCGCGEIVLEKFFLITCRVWRYV